MFASSGRPLHARDDLVSNSIRSLMCARMEIISGEDEFSCRHVATQLVLAGAI
jgi:hypothetical protein